MLFQSRFGTADPLFPATPDPDSSCVPSNCWRRRCRCVRLTHSDFVLAVGMLCAHIMASLHAQPVVHTAKVDQRIGVLANLHVWPTSVVVRLRVLVGAAETDPPNDIGSHPAGAWPRRGARSGRPAGLHGRLNCSWSASRRGLRLRAGNGEPGVADRCGGGLGGVWWCGGQRRRDDTKVARRRRIR